jgi:predicted dehydrogenase
MRRFSDQYHLVKRLMDAGYVGRVTAIRERVGHDGGLRLPEGAWRRSFETIAGAWSLLGVHSADLFRWYGGPVKRIAAIGKTLVSPMEGDDNFGAVLEFSSGTVGVIESCYNMVPGNDLLEVYGDRGTVILSVQDRFCRCQSVDAGDFPWAEHLNGLQPTQGPRGWWEFDAAQVQAAALSPFPDYFHHWVDCLQNDREPATTGEEGRASLEIILGGYDSSARSQFVDLSCQTW